MQPCPWKRRRSTCPGTCCSTSTVPAGPARAIDPARSFVHLLDTSEVVTQGVRFLGCILWSEGVPPGEVDRTHGESSYDFALIRLLYERRGKQQEQRRWLASADAVRLHRQQCAWLLARLGEPFDGKTVVITHHAPHDLTGEFFEVPALWVHGHTLESLDYCVGLCRVVCNARGNPKAWPGEVRNPSFDPALVIDLDDLDQSGGSPR